MPRALASETADVHVRFPLSEWLALKAEAEKQGRTASNLIRLYVRSELGKGSGKSE